MKVKKFIVYDSSGKILRTGTCPEEGFEIQAQTGEFVMEGMAIDSFEYVRDGKILPRPTMNIHLNGTVLEGVPIGSKVYVDGEFTGICESGYVEFNKSTQDSYQIKFSLFPYLDSEVTV